jgi:CheY-like chemotaxis protein
LIAAAPGKVPAESERIRREAILVVDDEESFRSVVVRQPRSAGFATIEACDGADALEKFADHREEVTAKHRHLTPPKPRF